MSAAPVDAEVIVIGTGFGGAVAALRLAEAGHQVVALERGDWITRAAFEADLDFAWVPDRGAFGMHDFRLPGKQLFAWLGAGVGGGSNLFAATVKRRADFAGFPDAIAGDDMGRYYARAEAMMGATTYPARPPYDAVRATQLMYRIGAALEAAEPTLIVERGPLPLAQAFAPSPELVGQPFVNVHGAAQRYSDPEEQAILGGDIECKNSLDRNYLHLAQARGVEIRALHEVEAIEPIDGGYRLHGFVRERPRGRWQRFLRRWLPRRAAPMRRPLTLTARRVVVACGALGSTELLLRSRARHQLLAASAPVGQRYSTNGDYITLMIPFRGLWWAYGAVAAAVAAAALGLWWLLIPAALVYYGALAVSDRAYDPDRGVTNSDHIMFRGHRGQPDGLLVEGGRFPTLDKWSLAALMSAFKVYRPERYRWVSRVMRFVRRWIPPFEAIARTWPIPLLTMGRDDALGVASLTAEDRLTIDFPIAANGAFYRHADAVGRKIAKAGRAWWLPNLGYRWFGRMQVPHNLGGVPMGAAPTEGVVDDCGRVFGRDDLVVLDGSIIPVAVGPNPSLTILAVAERAVEHIVADLAAGGPIRAQPASPTPTPPAPRRRP